MGADFIDEDDCHWDSALDWFWCGVLGGCGCGLTSNTADAWDVLDWFSQDVGSRDWGWFRSEDKYEILAHWIDSKGLIEHGSNVSGSWLTEKGQAIHARIKEAVG